MIPNAICCVVILQCLGNNEQEYVCSAFSMHFFPKYFLSCSWVSLYNLEATKTESQLPMVSSKCSREQQYWDRVPISQEGTASKVARCLQALWQHNNLSANESNRHCCQAYNPSTQGMRQEDNKLKSYLNYQVNSRPAWAIQWRPPLQ